MLLLALGEDVHVYLHIRLHQAEGWWLMLVAVGLEIGWADSDNVGFSMPMLVIRVHIAPLWTHTVFITFICEFLPLIQLIVNCLS